MQLVILAVAHEDSAVRSQLGQNVLYVEADKGLGNDRGHGGGEGLLVVAADRLFQTAVELFRV